jgi:hypothetical protein
MKDWDESEAVIKTPEPTDSYVSVDLLMEMG